MMKEKERQKGLERVGVTELAQRLRHKKRVPFYVEFNEFAAQTTAEVNFRERGLFEFPQNTIALEEISDRENENARPKSPSIKVVWSEVENMLSEPSPIGFDMNVIS